MLKVGYTTKKEFHDGYRYTKWQQVLTEFANSDHEVMTLEDDEVQAKALYGNVGRAVRHFGFAMKVHTHGGKVYIVKISK